MKRPLRILAWIFTPLLLIWLLLTLWVQQSRPAISWSSRPEAFVGRALILYNPDPIYNFYVQLAQAFSEGLKETGWASTATAYETLRDSLLPPFDFYVIIANTYNWAPDWPTRHFIENTPWLEGKSVVAITLGSGATGRSQRLLEELLKSRQVELRASRTFWLLRPNDESRLQEPNVKVAQGMVRTWAGSLAQEFSVPRTKDKN